ncbi:MAG: PilZ domain-containing protein [Spirochaetota bacterium]
MQPLQSDSTVALQPEPAGIPGEFTAERRADERYSVLRRVIIIVGKKRYDGYTIDISRRGISFIAAGEVPRGPVELQIPELRSFLSGRIVDLEESDPRRLRRYHAEFTTPLESGELDRITAI